MLLTDKGAGKKTISLCMQQRVVYRVMHASPVVSLLPLHGDEISQGVHKLKGVKLSRV